MRPPLRNSDGTIDYDTHKAKASRLRTKARSRTMRWIGRSALALVCAPWRAVRAAIRHWQRTWPAADSDRSRPPRVSVYADLRK